MKDTMNQVDAYIGNNLDRYVGELVRLCAQPSVAAQDMGMHECANLVEDILHGHGADVTVYQTAGYPIIVGRIAGKSERTLLFYNHYDVQPVEPLNLWTTPPFDPSVREGKIFGRGAKDDKGEIIARLAAIDALSQAYDGQLPCTVMFVIEGEEEISSPNIAAFVRQHANVLRCQGAVWEGGDIGRNGYPILALGVRGILEVELSVGTLARDAHSGGAHVMPSAAWRLIWALSTLKGLDERIRIPGFYDDAHGPSARDLAIFDRMWVNNLAYEEQMRNLYGIREFAGGRHGADLLRSVFSPTCNVQGMGSGYQGEGSKTIVPSEAKAKIDFRLVPDQDPEDIFQKLRGYLDNQGFQDVTTTMMGWMGPARTDLDDPLVQLVVRTGHEVYGGLPSIVPLIGGSSPGYAFKEPLKIPVVTAGVGYWDNRPHAPDEHIRIQDFQNGMRHLARILDGFAKM